MKLVAILEHGSFEATSKQQVRVKAIEEQIKLVRTTHNNLGSIAIRHLPLLLVNIQ